jgi:Carboxypeptidase regulatory-like domain
MSSGNISAKIVVFLFLAFLVTGVDVSPAGAQVLYGTVLGTVEDKSGGAVPEASVSITNRGTGESRATRTNSRGAYNFANVLPGRYDLRVTASGFQVFTTTNVSVTGNTVSRVDTTLEVGQVNQSLTVAAAAATIQTDKADVHLDLSSQAVADLPTGGYRNYQALLSLVPGATPSQLQATPLGAPQRSLGTNINGTARANNNNRLDGAINIRITQPEQALYIPPIESIETVNVSTNAFDAEQGFAGGAVVTVTTKSGTNQFHGVAYENINNADFNAKDFFYKGTKNPQEILNLFGGTFGGPIKKDKIFFFGSYEGLRELSNTSRTLTIPTAAQGAGDFSGTAGTIYDPATVNFDGTGRTPFPGNIVPLGRQSTITRTMQSYIPDTNLPGNVSNYFTSQTVPFNRDTYDVKVNWNRTDRQTFWAKVSYLRAHTVSPSTLGPAGGNGMAAGTAGPGWATTGSMWEASAAPIRSGPTSS